MKKFYKTQEIREADGKVIGLVSTSLSEDSLEIYRGENKSLYIAINASKNDQDKWKKAQDLEILEITEAEYNELIKDTPQAKALWEEKKKQRDITLNNQIATLGENQFETDEVAMDRFNRIVSLANFKYNQAIISGLSPQEASAIYETRIQWKSAENKFIELSVKELAELLQSGMQQMQTLWGEIG